MDPGGYDKGKAHVNRNDCMNKLIFIVLPGLLMIFRGADSAEVNVAADETRKTIYDPRQERHGRPGVRRRRREVCRYAR